MGILGSIPQIGPTLGQAAKNKVWSYGSKLKGMWKNIDPASKSLALKQSIKTIGYEILWQLEGTPDVLLGIIPIRAVQRYEVGRSSEKMKYRAVAGQFFAHQRGGRVAFKVVMYLVGPESLYYLLFLQSMQLYGEGSYENINELSNNASTTAGLIVSDVSATDKQMEKSFDKQDTSWRTYEKHRTFPIITKEEIMHDMYIETILYERDITFGDAIKVTVLCRRYVRPLSIAYIKMLSQEKSGAIVTLSQKDARVQDASGTYSKSLKQIVIGYNKLDYGFLNKVGLATQLLHAIYVTSFVNHYTDLERLRSTGSRLNGTIYLLSGKNVILEDGGIIIGDIGKSETEESKDDPVESIVNSKLSKVEFSSPIDANTYVISNPAKAKLIKIVKDKNYFYNIEVSTQTSNYYGRVELSETGLSVSDIVQSGTPQTKYNINTNCFIAPEDYSFLILIFKSGDTYEFYNYNGTFINSVYFSAKEKLREL